MSTAVIPPPQPASEPGIQQVQVHPLIRQAVRRLGLTPREGDLTELLAVGCPTTMVSMSLGISEATIRTHLRKIFASQQIASRVELVALVLGEVLTEIDDREQRQLLAS